MSATVVTLAALFFALALVTLSEQWQTAWPHPAWLSKRRRSIAWVTLAALSPTTLAIGALTKPDPPPLVAPGQHLLTDEDFDRKLAPFLARLPKDDAVRDFEPPSPGCALVFIGRFNGLARDRDNFVLDFLDANGVRVSLFYDKRGVTFLRVTDGDRAVEVSVLPAFDRIKLGAPMVLLAEYGSTATYSFLRIAVNGRQMAHERFTPPLRVFNFSPGAFSEKINADIAGHDGAGIDMVEYAALKVTPSPDEERALLAYANEKYAGTPADAGL